VLPGGTEFQGFEVKRRACATASCVKLPLNTWVSPDSESGVGLRSVVFNHDLTRLSQFIADGWLEFLPRTVEEIYEQEFGFKI
jgi:hypothetical protein